MQKPVDLRADADGGVGILDQDPVVGDLVDGELLELDTPRAGANEPAAFERQDGRYGERSIQPSTHLLNMPKNSRMTTHSLREYITVHVSA